MKNTLATNNIDLRPFLVSYLMGQELKNTDYDAYDEATETLVNQKKTLATGNKTINSIQGAFKSMVDEKQHKVKSAVFI